MEATIVWGLSRNIRHTETLPVEEAFRKIKELTGYTFINIYFGNRLVYTTQGAAGYRFQCDDCPYHKMTGKSLPRKQFLAVYGR